MVGLGAAGTTTNLWANNGPSMWVPWVILVTFLGSLWLREYATHDARKCLDLSFPQYCEMIRVLAALVDLTLLFVCRWFQSSNGLCVTSEAPDPDCVQHGVLASDEASGHDAGSWE